MWPGGALLFCGGPGRRARPERVPWIHGTGSGSQIRIEARPGCATADSTALDHGAPPGGALLYIMFIIGATGGIQATGLRTGCGRSDSPPLSETFTGQVI